MASFSLVFAFALANAVAQQPLPLDVNDQGAPVFTVFTAQDGLSDEIWNVVDVDSQGFVWAGSASQLARFDGYRWRLWPVSGARSLVQDLALDPKGQFWALFGREGLARLNGDHWTLQGVAPPAVMSFSEIEQPGAELWYTQGAGLFQWRNGVWHADPGNVVLPQNTAISTAFTATLFGGPRQWLASRVGLWFRTVDATGNGPWRVFEEPRLAGLLTNGVLSNAIRDGEELWVLSYGGGIARIREDGIRVWRAASGELPTESIYGARITVRPSGQSELWVASRAGLLRIHDEEVRTFDRRHGLPSDAVRAVEIQHDVDGVDLLWVATEGGIARATLGESQWRTVSLLGARENGVFGVLLEPDGRGGERLWVGTSREGLGLLENGEWRFFDASALNAPTRNIRHFARVLGPSGEIWRLLSTESGLFRIDDALQFKRINTPWQSPDVANHVLARPTKSGHELWFATQRSGVYRLQNERWTHFLADGIGPAWVVSRLVEQVDSNGRSWLWAASGAGLARFDGERWQLLKQFDDIDLGGFNTISLISEAGGPVLWAGSHRNGLVRLDVSDPWHPRLLDTQGIPTAPDPTIYTILADSQQRIYICTNNGVQQLTPREEGGYTERVFRRRDGLVHDECNTNSQFIDAQDRYWVGTLGGLSVFDPKIKTPTQQGTRKPLVLTEVRVDGVRVRAESTTTLSLPAGTRELVVEYALLAGYRESESRYRSQLINYDPEPSAWTAERRRSFTQPPPGTYQLQVEARDYAGNSQSSNLLRFEIPPFWWQQRFVWILFASITLLALAMGVMLYNRNLRSRQHYLRQEVARRTADLDDANQRLTELSYTDPLTGVANRRRLLEVLAAAIERAEKRQLPIGLIIVDVDQFKDYNDRHGHLAGDTALRAVAQALLSAMDPQDLVTRYGGEEFACLMIDADRESTLRSAERMRALVEALPPRTLGNDSQTITLSAGVLSCIPSNNPSVSELLQRADHALYEAKRAGRNRVQIAV